MIQQNFRIENKCDEKLVCQLFFIAHFQLYWANLAQISESIAFIWSNRRKKLYFLR